MEIEHSLEVRIRGAISRAFEAEGFNQDESFDLAKRGAELLVASEAPAPRSPEKPAALTTICKAADTTVTDRHHREVLSKLVSGRRITIAILAMSAGLVTFTFFNTVFKLTTAPRTENREARSTARRPREDMDLLPLFVILLVVFGLLLFTMPSF